MITKKDYGEWLNELEAHQNDLKSNGGLIPDRAKYGTWMRKNDPIAFSVGFREFEMGEQHRSRRGTKRISKRTKADHGYKVYEVDYVYRKLEKGKFFTTIAEAEKNARERIKGWVEKPDRITSHRYVNDNGKYIIELYVTSPDESSIDYGTIIIEQ